VAIHWVAGLTVLQQLTATGFNRISQALGLIIIGLALAHH
jgi:hypothetical protein